MRRFSNACDANSRALLYIFLALSIATLDGAAAAGNSTLKQSVYDNFDGLVTTRSKEDGSSTGRTGRTTPEAAAAAVQEFTVTAHRYAFSPARIEVKHGDIVKLTVLADDIPHSVTIDAFRISKRVAPGEAVTIEFRADQVGTHPFYCSLTAEEGCRRMRGELIVR